MKLLRKSFFYTLALICLLCSPFLTRAQDSIRKLPPSEAPQPAQISPATANPAGTVQNPDPNAPNVGTPSAAPPPSVKRRRRVVDSLAITTAQLDSTARAIWFPFIQILNDTTSAASIAHERTPAADSAALAFQKPIIADSTTAKKDSNAAVNPFDIQTQAQKPDTAVAKAPVSAPATNSFLSPEVYSKNFLFWVFLIMFLLLAFVVSATRYAVSATYQSLLKEGSFRTAFKEQTGWGSLGYLSLYVLYWINAGIFVFLTLNHYHFHSAYGQFSTFLLCVLAVGAVFIVKHLILYIVAAVFPIEKSIRQYNFIVIISGVLIGLILAPINIFIAYAPASMTETFIYTGFFVITAVYLLRMFRSLSIGAPYLMTNRFHFFIYLCSVEIAPLIILIKLVLPGKSGL